MHFVTQLCILLSIAMVMGSPKEYELECMKAAQNISEHEIADGIVNPKKDSNGVDKRIKCFLDCIFKSLGITSGQSFIEKMPSDAGSINDGTEVIKCWDKQTQGDDCQRAYEFVLCLRFVI
ncbi:maker106 [Drosophila busckii]|uniref:Maker106 n=1 Tax=Drosophila busckii TaxID=30019 RepID=A0A0M3QVE6_DROBS|nr:maker106 [Drosophila busckii]